MNAPTTPAVGKQTVSPFQTLDMSVSARSILVGQVMEAQTDRIAQVRFILDGRNFYSLTLTFRSQ